MPHTGSMAGGAIASNVSGVIGTPGASLRVPHLQCSGWPLWYPRGMKSTSLCVLVSLLCAACSSSAPTSEEAAAPAPAPAAAWNVQVAPLAVPATGQTDSPQLTASASGAILSWL